MGDLIDTQLPAAAASVREARAALICFDELDEEAFAAVQIIVSELFSNAILHGQLGADDQVRLRVLRLPDRVRVEVSDPGRGFTTRSEAGLVQGDDRVGGIGLGIVQAIASRFGIHRNQGLTTSWAELDL
jgi:anti-sigma regulatory factor (Ser/Thr protein kinase)